MSDFALYRVVDVKCSPVPGVRHEKVWTADEFLGRPHSDLDETAIWFMLRMRQRSDIDRVEWMQDGEHYLLTRAK